MDDETACLASPPRASPLMASADIVHNRFRIPWTSGVGHLTIFGGNVIRLPGDVPLIKTLAFPNMLMLWRLIVA
jgi:hypothetical protein